jgi:hypothetical protein
LQDYVSEVNSIFDDMLATGNVDAFVRQLKETNEYWLNRFAQEGYMATGGMGDAYKKAGVRAAEFINSFADKFGADMASDLNRDWRWRAMLYPREGNRLAYVLGQQAAMSERGARAWQRRLHPEMSVTGPCVLCINDSMLVHSIEEPFQLLHVNDVCDVIETIAYYPTPPERIEPGQPPMVEMPVPQRIGLPDVIRLLREAVGRLGKIGQSIVRRVRGQ